MNEAILPDPGSPRPIDVLSFVQSKTVDGTDPEKEIKSVASPSQYSNHQGSQHLV